jgi:hypothetical protein
MFLARGPTSSDSSGRERPPQPDGKQLSPALERGRRVVRMGPPPAPCRPAGQRRVGDGVGHHLGEPVELRNLIQSTSPVDGSAPVEPEGDRAAPHNGQQAIGGLAAR